MSKIYQTRRNIMKKKLLSLALAGVLVFSLCACGNTGSTSDTSESSSKKYKELTEMLNEGQYDAAITYIEKLRDEAENSDEDDEDDDDSRSDLVAKLIGDYEPTINSTDYADYSNISINKDRTITVDGATYTYELNEYPDYGYIDLSYTDNSGSHKSFSVYTYDNGYITLNNTYAKVGCLDDTVSEYFETMAGEYISSNDDWSTFESITVNSDMTVTLGDETYPVAYTYSDYDDTIRYYIDGYSEYDTAYTVLSFEKDEDTGIDKAMYYYYRADQIEFVDITADNFYDYFEWSDYKQDYATTNAFGETEYIYFARYLQLKDEYTDKFLRDFSNIAIEISYEEVRLDDCVAIYNPTTGSITVSDGVRDTNSWYMDTLTPTYQYISYEYDDDYNVLFYYIDDFGFYMYLIGDYRDLASFENGVYTSEVKVDAGALYGSPSISRSATTLAFVK